MTLYVCVWAGGGGFKGFKTWFYYVRFNLLAALMVLVRAERQDLTFLNE